MAQIKELQTTIISEASGKRRTIKVESVGPNFAYRGTVYAGGHELAETILTTFAGVAQKNAIHLANQI